MLCDLLPFKKVFMVQATRLYNLLTLIEGEVDFICQVPNLIPINYRHLLTETDNVTETAKECTACLCGRHVPCVYIFRGLCQGLCLWFSNSHYLSISWPLSSSLSSLPLSVCLSSPSLSLQSALLSLLFKICLLRPLTWAEQTYHENHWHDRALWLHFDTFCRVESCQSMWPFSLAKYFKFDGKERRDPWSTCWTPLKTLR